MKKKFRGFGPEDDRDDTETSEYEVTRLRTALEFYANRANWRSGNDTLDLRLLDPVNVNAELVGGRCHIGNGWEVAEYALYRIVPTAAGGSSERAKAT